MRQAGRLRLILTADREFCNASKGGTRRKYSACTPGLPRCGKARRRSYGARGAVLVHRCTGSADQGDSD
jgi:hypothetical protein